MKRWLNDHAGFVGVVAMLVCLCILLTARTCFVTRIDMPDTFSEYVVAFDTEMTDLGYERIPMVYEYWDGAQSLLSYGYAYHTPDGYAYCHESGEAITMYIPEAQGPLGIYSELFPEISFLVNTNDTLPDGRHISWILGINDTLHITREGSFNGVISKKPRLWGMSTYYHQNYSAAMSDIYKHKDEGRINWFYTRYGNEYSDLMFSIWDDKYNTIHSVNTQRDL